MSLPNKKRKFSSDVESPLPPIEMASPKERKDSGDAIGSVGSDDTAAMALKAVAALDGHNLTLRRHPFKKRRTSMDDSMMDDDQALGLAPLGPIAEDQKETPPKSNTADGASTATKGSGLSANNETSTALDHLDALGDESESLGSKQKDGKPKAKTDEVMIGDEESSNSWTLASSNQRAFMEALMSSSSAGSHYYRDRLESWGGMSDLSAAGLGADRMDAAAAFAASALHYTGLIEDVTAAANSCSTSLASQGSEEQGKPNAVPSKISLKSERKHSDGSEYMAPPDFQAFVDAAMATVGDQLAEIAGAVEMAAAGTDVTSITSDYLRKEAGIDSDVSSTASPLIGPISDLASLGGRPRSLSTSSKPLSVDYDAVAAAVDAAQAATGSLDLSSIAAMGPRPVPSVVIPGATVLDSMKKGDRGDTSSNLIPPPAPTSAPLHQPLRSNVSEKDMDAIRAMARAAAGYVPPSGDSPATPAPRPPLKKRANKQPTQDSSKVQSSHDTRTQPGITPAYPDAPMSSATPRISNHSSRRPLATTTPTPYPPTTPSSTMSSAAKASGQKWDDMLECLIQFKEERRAEELKGASAKEKEEWVWDGNVPTTYKVGCYIPDWTSLFFCKLTMLLNSLRRQRMERPWVDGSTTSVLQRTREISRRSEKINLLARGSSGVFSRQIPGRI